MILPFSTQINGKPSYFVERIHSGILENKLSEIDGIYLEKSDISKSISITPKIHTIREDKKNRWKIGTMIHFFINVRQKNMFMFAPVLSVVSTQKFEIIYLENRDLKKTQVWLDDVFCLYYRYGDRVIDKGLLEFAQNDGFDTIESFFEYFNKDFTGKLIHWTDKRY